MQSTQSPNNSVSVQPGPEEEKMCGVVSDRHCNIFKTIITSLFIITSLVITIYSFVETGLPSTFTLQQQNIDEISTLSEQQTCSCIFSLKVYSFWTYDLAQFCSNFQGKTCTTSSGTLYVETGCLNSYGPFISNLNQSSIIIPNVDENYNTYINLQLASGAQSKFQYIACQGLSDCQEIDDCEAPMYYDVVNNLVFNQTVPFSTIKVNCPNTVCQTFIETPKSTFVIAILLAVFTLLTAVKEAAMYGIETYQEKKNESP